MRISDWSADVCSSDLYRAGNERPREVHSAGDELAQDRHGRTVEVALWRLVLRKGRTAAPEGAPEWFPGLCGAEQVLARCEQLVDRVGHQYHRDRRLQYAQSAKRADQRRLDDDETDADHA